MALTTTRIYRSTDSGAPSLAGVVGSGIAWLKACLVGNVSGVAYGAGVNEKVAAGWTVEFEDAVNNVCVFRNSLAAGGSGCYLRVDDNGSGAGGAKDMRVWIYESMTDANTGIGQTPATADQSLGVIWPKSSVASATARPWVLMADERTVYPGLSPTYGASPVEGHQVGGAGDYDSDDPAQPFPCFVAGASVASTNTFWGPCCAGLAQFRGQTDQKGIWCVRGPGGAAVPISATVAMQLSPPGQYAMGGSQSVLAASPAGSHLAYFQRAILFGGAEILGRLRGVYTPLNDMTALDLGAEITAAQGLPAGSVLTILRGANAQIADAGFRGRIAVESRLPW